MKFDEIIIAWYHVNKRNLPWRNTKNPYKIWLSEIILQQTRVEQGKPYYEKFIKTFPTVFDLAKADESTVLKLWQGLGYYSRARNLHYSAKMIVNDFDGKFPNTFDTIIKLKGVGTYTAAAIASFSFGEIVPVVDGNVYRVLSRIYGIEDPIDTGKGQKYFFKLAQELISQDKPEDFNQAIMEFGALQCVPKNPACESCPFIDKCIAKSENKISVLPIKKGKTKVTDLYLNYFVFYGKGKLLVRLRGSKGIWANMYDFPCIESYENQELDQIIKENEWLKNAINQKEIKKIITYNHKLSHRNITATFYWIKTCPKLNVKNQEISYKEVKEFEKLPISRLIDKFWHHFSKTEAVGRLLDS